MTDKPGDPYDEGYEAYEKGVALTGNPYEQRDDGHDEWENGWNAADADARYWADEEGH